MLLWSGCCCATHCPWLTHVLCHLGPAPSVAVVGGSTPVIVVVGVSYWTDCMAHASMTLTTLGCLYSTLEFSIPLRFMWLILTSLISSPNGFLLPVVWDKVHFQGGYHVSPMDPGGVFSECTGLVLPMEHVPVLQHVSACLSYVLGSGVPWWSVLESWLGLLTASLLTGSLLTGSLLTGS